MLATISHEIRHFEQKMQKDAKMLLFFEQEQLPILKTI